MLVFYSVLMLVALGVAAAVIASQRGLRMVFSNWKTMTTRTSGSRVAQSPRASRRPVPVPATKSMIRKPWGW